VRRTKAVRAFTPTLFAIALAALVDSCGHGTAYGEPAQRYERATLQQRLDSLEEPGLVIGEFPLARKAVVDGDTIKVDGLRTSLRLLAIDTEEKPRGKDRRLIDSDWEGYVAKKQKGAVKPVKMSSPMGDEATRWAKEFFSGVEQVRLERDHPKEIRGRYGRYLVYVFAKKGNGWVNYNVEAVRAGMTPYFTKYGYSRRFHDEFVAAQKEARAALRGIWDPNAKAYPDYDARLAWWNTRAELIQAFEREAQKTDDLIVLTNYDSLARIEALEGKQVEVLGTVADIRRGDRGPTLVFLSRKMHADFPLVFFDKDVFASCGIDRHRGEFVRVRGKVNRYRNERTQQEQLQIVVSLPSHIRGAKLPWTEEPTSE